MFNRLKDELGTVNAAELAKRARQRVQLAREEGVERLWELQADTLERVEEALGRAPENVPVLSRVADAAERIVSRTRETVTAVPIGEYDELNAKVIRTKLRELGHIELLRVRRYETAHKSRKSVLNDIDRELERRFRPAAVAEVVEGEAAADSGEEATPS